MYPTPVKGSKLYIKTLNSEEVSYRIINMLGQTVKNGKASTEIDVENLKSGIYFLEINDSEDVMIRKFIKQ